MFFNNPPLEKVNGTKVPNMKRYGHQHQVPDLVHTQDHVQACKAAPPAPPQ